MRRPSKTPAPKTHRNGLKWRDGRPRWEPSPTLRRLGLRGRDLKDEGGAWVADRGLALSLADARHAWAQAIRLAAAGGHEGRQAAEDLRTALEAMDAQEGPRDADGRMREIIVDDLIAAARGHLDGPEAAPGQAVREAADSVNALVDRFFEDVAAGRVEIKASTAKVYRVVLKKLREKFGRRRASTITRGQLKDWYRDDLLEDLAVATANLTMGAVSAVFSHATRIDPPWLTASPATDMKLRSAKGRLVFWTLGEEAAYVTWCDANGFEDVADAVVGLLWTGARPIDLCAATLDDLAGDTWRYTPIKTELKEQEAMPAIMDPLRRRLDLRKQRRVANISRAFLVDPQTGKKLTRPDLGVRHNLARSAFIAANPAFGGFADKQLRDCRDTCITRLYEADIPPARVWTWTGHSQKTIERIIRQHYLVLRETQAMELAGKLAAWAERNGVSLAS